MERKRRTQRDRVSVQFIYFLSVLCSAGSLGTPSRCFLLQPGVGGFRGAWQTSNLAGINSRPKKPHFSWWALFAATLVGCFSPDLIRGILGPRAWSEGCQDTHAWPWAPSLIPWPAWGESHDLPSCTARLAGFQLCNPNRVVFVVFFFF